MKNIIKRIMPEKYHGFLKYIYSTIWFFGFRFKCPCCGGYFRKFIAFGDIPRSNAQCPRCGSLERHRLLWLYLSNRTNFFAKHLKVLDIGPTNFLQKKFKRQKNLIYVSVDIQSPIAMIKMDITNLGFSDNQFDCIICYHVLEHIPDDKKAMLELYRVLRQEGWAILQTPVSIKCDKTIEYLNPKEGTSFEPICHVRRYGQDYRDKLEEAGFIVKLDEYIKELGDDKIERYRLDKYETIYLCIKQKPE